MVSFPIAVHAAFSPTDGHACRAFFRLVQIFAGCYIGMRIKHMGCIMENEQIEKLRDALKSIGIYGLDTLSGRADGGLDDRAWHRQAIKEMARLASQALKEVPAASGEVSPTGDQLYFMVTSRFQGGSFPWSMVKESGKKAWCDAAAELLLPPDSILAKFGRSTVEAPAAAVADAPSMLLQLDRRLGMYGQAFDPPGPCRAYTYQHQPANVAASRLGMALARAAAALGGDRIDSGLSLLKSLQAAGFGVFEIEPSDAAPQAPQPSGNPGQLDGHAEYRRALMEAFNLANMTNANRQGRTAEETCAQLVRRLGELANGSDAAIAASKEGAPS